MNTEPDKIEIAIKKTYKIFGIPILVLKILEVRLVPRLVIPIPPGNGEKEKNKPR